MYPVSNHRAHNEYDCILEVSKHFIIASHSIFLKFELLTYVLLLLLCDISTVQDPVSLLSSKNRLSSNNKSIYYIHVSCLLLSNRIIDNDNNHYQWSGLVIRLSTFIEKNLYNDGILLPIYILN